MVSQDSEVFQQWLQPINTTKDPWCASIAVNIITLLKPYSFIFGKNDQDDHMLRHFVEIVKKCLIIRKGGHHLNMPEMHLAPATHPRHQMLVDHPPLFQEWVSEWVVS